MYIKTIWQNDVTDVDATNMNHIEDGIEKAYGVVLLAVVDTAPSECSVGDKYFNTTTNKIYEATATDTWDTEGYDAESGVFYVVFSERAIYTYNGTTLVGVGSSGAGGESIPVGVSVAYMGTTAPQGYLMEDGTLKLISEYPELYSVLGHRYDLPTDTDNTKFRLPNKCGRVLVGLDSTQTEFDTLGETGGSKYLQEHSHDTQIHSGGSQGLVGFMGLTNGTNYTTLAGGSQFGIQNAGTGDSGNLQPYIVVNYIIKAHPSAVNTSEVVNEHSTSETDVYSANYVNGIIESGSNANGKYIKYIDGTMICTKEISTTIGNWESWGSLFEGYISGGNFPQEFIETPIMNITNIGTGGAMVESVESISKSDFGKIYFARPTTQASTIVKVDIIAIGRWK